MKSQRKWLLQKKAERGEKRNNEQMGQIESKWQDVTFKAIFIITFNVSGASIPTESTDWIKKQLYAAYKNCN